MTTYYIFFIKLARLHPWAISGLCQSVGMTHTTSMYNGVSIEEQKLEVGK